MGVKGLEEGNEFSFEYVEFRYLCSICEEATSRNKSGLNTVMWEWSIIVIAKTLKSGCHHPSRIMNISRMRAEEGTLEDSGRRDLEGSKDVIDMGDCGSEV